MARAAMAIDDGIVAYRVPPKCGPSQARVQSSVRTAATMVYTPRTAAAPCLPHRLPAHCARQARHEPFASYGKRRAMKSRRSQRPSRPGCACEFRDASSRSCPGTNLLAGSVHRKISGDDGKDTLRVPRRYRARDHPDLTAARIEVGGRPGTCLGSQGIVIHSCSWML